MSCVSVTWWDASEGVPEGLLWLCIFLILLVSELLMGRKVEVRVVGLGGAVEGLVICVNVPGGEGRGCVVIVGVFLLLGAFLLVGGICVRSLALSCTLVMISDVERV